MTDKKMIGLGATGVVVLIVIITIFMGLFQVPENTSTVVTRFSKIERIVTTPGLSVKIPWITSVTEISHLPYTTSLNAVGAGTSNELEILLTASVTWYPDQTRVKEFYRKYRTVEGFESIRLRPTLMQAAKSSIGSNDPKQLLQNRDPVNNSFLKEMQEKLANEPVILVVTNLEKLDWPDAYTKAIEDAERKKQEKNGAMMVADGVAYKLGKEAEGRANAIKLEAQAKADGIKAIGDAKAAAAAKLKAELTPLVVDYKRAETWNGALPHTMLGSSTGTLWNMDKK